MSNFGTFLSEFGYHGNFLCSLENSDNTLQIADPKNPTIRRKKFSISCKELKLVQFWLNFAQIWLPWQLPWLPEKFGYHIWIHQPHKLHYTFEKFLDFLHRIKFCATWAYFCVNLVAMATPVGTLEFYIAYVNLPTTKTLLFMQKFPQFLAQY